MDKILIDVDFWSQEQTLHPRGQTGRQHMYAGTDRLWPHWSDFIPAIPLDIRFQSFKRRLAKVLEKHG